MQLSCLYPGLKFQNWTLAYRPWRLVTNLFHAFLSLPLTVQRQQTGTLGGSTSVRKPQEDRDSVLWAQPHLVRLHRHTDTETWPQLPPQGQTGHPLDTTDWCHYGWLILYWFFLKFAWWAVCCFVCVVSCVFIWDVPSLIIMPVDVIVFLQPAHQKHDCFLARLCLQLCCGLFFAVLLVE